MCVLDVSNRKIVYYRAAVLVIGVDAQNLSDFSNATGIQTVTPRLRRNMQLPNTGPDLMSQNSVKKNLD